MSKRSLKLVLGGALLVVVALGLAFVSRQRPKARLRAYKASLVAQGEKLTIDELASRPSVEAQQATRALLQAAQQFRVGVVLPHNLPGSMKAILPGRARVGWKQPDLRLPGETNTWEQLAADLDADRETLRQIREILKSPAVGFDLDYRQGFRLLVSHRAPILKTAQRLSAVTLYELHEGRLEDAAANLEALLALIEVLRDEPLLMSQIGREVMARTAFATTWDALQADGWTDAQLALIQERWEALEFLAPMKRAMDMERAIGLDTFNQARASAVLRRQLLDRSSLPWPWPALPDEVGDVPELGKRVASSLPLWIREQRWLWADFYTDELKFLQAFDLMQPVKLNVQVGGPFALPYRQMTTDLGEFDLQVTRSTRYLLTEMLTPGLARAFWRSGELEMQHELAVAAIALKRHHLRHGAWAPSLVALVPEFLSRVPRDFMDGGELRYRVNANGTWILYSVGENGVDDGGNPQPSSEKSQTKFFGYGLDAVWPQPATPEEVAREEEASQRVGMDAQMMKRYGLVPAK